MGRKTDKIPMKRGAKSEMILRLAASMDVSFETARQRLVHSNFHFESATAYLAGRSARPLPKTEITRQVMLAAGIGYHGARDAVQKAKGDLGETLRLAKQCKPPRSGSLAALILKLAADEPTYGLARIRHAVNRAKGDLSATLDWLKKPVARNGTMSKDILALASAAGVSVGTARRALVDNNFHFESAESQLKARRYRSRPGRTVANGTRPPLRSVKIAAHVLAREFEHLSIRRATELIRKVGHDMERARAAYRANAFGTLDGKPYPTRTAFVRAVANKYKFGRKKLLTIARQRRATATEVIAILRKAQARANAVRKTKPKAARKTFAIFGWRFRSKRAACDYYGIATGTLDRIMRTNDCRIEVAFLRVLNDHWRFDRLDDRNRFFDESRIDPRSLPLNGREEPEEPPDAEKRFMKFFGSGWADVAVRDEEKIQRAAREAEAGAGPLHLEVPSPAKGLGPSGEKSDP